MERAPALLERGRERQVSRTASKTVQHLHMWEDTASREVSKVCGKADAFEDLHNNRQDGYSLFRIVCNGCSVREQGKDRPQNVAATDGNEWRRIMAMKGFEWRRVATRGGVEWWLRMGDEWRRVVAQEGADTESPSRVARDNIFALCAQLFD